MFTDYFKLLRIKHYVKNILVAVPLVFSRQLLESTDMLIRTGLAMLCFSFVSSSVYIINDIMDRHKDAKHPKKYRRPIASGSIRVREAVLIAMVLLLASFVGSLYLSISALAILAAYFALNLAYSIRLKNVPVIEVAILASGFLIRILYGGFATGIEVSSWLYLTILSGSFYLGLGKRRNELEKLSNCTTREVLNHYNSRFLDRNMYMFLAATICFYSLWAMEQGRWALYSIPIVMLTCMRYSLLVEGASDGDPVDVILKDKTLLSFVSIYSIYVLIAIYIA